MSADLEKLRARTAATFSRTAPGASVEIMKAPIGAVCPETLLDVSGQDVVSVRIAGARLFYSLAGLARIGVVQDGPAPITHTTRPPAPVVAAPVPTGAHIPSPLRGRKPPTLPPRRAVEPRPFRPPSLWAERRGRPAERIET